MKKLALLTIVSAGLVGCAGQWGYQKSPPTVAAGAVRHNVGDIPKSATGVFSGAKEIGKGKPIYYYQNFGGGGVALGLALGPFGALANAKMIESQTDSDVTKLAGKISIDPITLLKNISQSEKHISHVSENGVKLEPSLLIVKGEGERLHIACVLDASTTNWKGRYAFHVPNTVPLGDIESGLTEEIQKAVSLGYSQVLDMLESDMSGKFLAKKDVNYYSEAVSPRFRFDLQGKLIESNSNYVTILGPTVGDEVNVTLASGYHRYARESVTLK